MNGGSTSNRTPPHRQLPRMALLIHDSLQSTLNYQLLSINRGFRRSTRIFVSRTKFCSSVCKLCSQLSLESVEFRVIAMLMLERQRYFRCCRIPKRFKHKFESFQGAVGVNEIVAIVNERGVVCVRAQPD